MVRGLELFREHFQPFTDQYLLIGGTAAMLAMAEAGLDFRATKDLDLVLHVEALTPAFGKAFWRFVAQGGYELRQKGGAARRNFYRFHRPANPAFPFMLELFARAAATRGCGGCHRRAQACQRCTAAFPVAGR